MTKKSISILAICMVIFWVAIVSLLLTGMGVTASPADAICALTTLAGLVGGIYPIVRALVRLLGGPLFPGVPIPGTWAGKCAIVGLVGLFIGLTAPIWAAFLWAVGAAVLWLTQGYEN